MAASKPLQKAEYKRYNISFPFPETGVNYHWCYQNATSYHNHDFYEFTLITDGKVQHLHNGKKCVGSKGMLFLIKPEEYHQFSPFNDTPTKQINFSITPQMFERLTSTIWQYDILEKINKCEIPNDLTLPKKTWDNIFNLVDQINQSPEAKNIHILVKTVILELTTCIMNRLEIAETLAPHQNAPTWLSNFLETLNNPSVFTLKLKDIYPLAPYSQSMLNIYFNKYVGMTLITYVTTLKVSYACNLLRYTDDSPLDISSKLSYDSLSHFNRVFKKMTGKTPIAYRKSARA